MSSRYYRKFDEMKKYIPFLESMIKKLESTASGSAQNPRQAQLDKIRSLRDLLLDKKKRMKMENLLKCEQVLINLYAKVEQRDSLPDIIKKKSDSVFDVDSPTPKEKNDLENVRNKLKVVTKLREEGTLPEIARANQIEETTVGKEPALFQRRPNKSPVRYPKSKPHDENMSSSHGSQSTRRSYTRVLVSPEPTSNRRSYSDESSNHLFKRRSPRQSPRHYSPSYYKKEKKRSTRRDGSSRKLRDLNITLNVPEESLNSLNTKDILSRIINCSDSDVDIDTLRELRSQILGELNQTGSNNDISDLLLKSYKKKKKSISKRKPDVEEGEISDSESEAIESIYGSLVVVDKDKATTSQAKHLDKDNKLTGKIQICLVINSDKNDLVDKLHSDKSIDMSDFEMFDDETKPSSSAKEKEALTIEKLTEDKIEHGFEQSQSDNKEVVLTKDVEIEKNDMKETEKTDEKDKTVEDLVAKLIENNTSGKLQEKTKSDKDTTQFKANFYKPLTEEGSTEKNNLAVLESQVINNIKGNTQTQTVDTVLTNVTKGTTEQHEIILETEKPVNIPLLNEPSIPKQPVEKTIVSEIDILQALKNEILSETIAIPGADVGTPPLHQPKLTKVASAKEIMPKKRISIEKYKEKSVTSKVKEMLRRDNKDSLSRNEQTKKSKIKLTEKECERFNLSARLSLDDDLSSDDEDHYDSDILIEDVYGDLAPLSPDDESLKEVVTKSPVIIPGDPIKVASVANKIDVDMRILPQIISPNPSIDSNSSGFSQDKITEKRIEAKQDKENITSDRIKLPLDPRVRKELSRIESPNPHINPERPPRSAPFSTPSMTPNMTPNSRSYEMTSTPNMTPAMTPNSRSYDMTPTHRSFEVDIHPKAKHVYAPFASSFDLRDNREQSVPRESRIQIECSKSSEDRIPHWELNRERDPRNKYIQRDSYPNSNGPRIEKYKIDRRENFRPESSSTPGPSFVWSDKSAPFGRLEAPMTPVAAFGKSDYPATYSHSLDRSNCPTTPSHSFGRADCPLTPTHSFGRNDAPTTPTHPFGRLDCPLTPIHSFGRSDYPTTPSHPFGRSECPLTPGNSFGRTERSDFQQNSSKQRFHNDPRLRRSDHEEDRERGIYKDRRYERNNSYNSQNRYHDSDHRNYQKDRRDNREDINRFSDQGRNYCKDQRSERNEGLTRSRGPESIRLKNIEVSGRCDDSSRSYDDVRSKQKYSEQNIDRKIIDEPHSRPRATSVGRNFQYDSQKDNILSVKSHAGRSFRIDTSVNATFQNFMVSKGLQMLNQSFDARRSRAASVGRSLQRESSVGRVHVQTDKQKIDVFNLNSNDRYKRASSVGRELTVTKSERSFSDIKADFKAFKAKIKFDTNVTDNRNFKNEQRRPVKDPGDRRDIYEQEKKKLPYSPRKNYRDPRMRRDLQNASNKNDNKNPFEKKTHGIIYSNDNIAKGTILGSGYGVKNYKIPKLKSVLEEERLKREKEEQERKEKEEKEKKEREEKEKLEREKKEREENERKEKEEKLRKEKEDEGRKRKEKLERERIEREKKEKECERKIKEEKERKDFERNAKEDKEKQVLEKIEKENAEKGNLEQLKTKEDKKSLTDDETKESTALDSPTKRITRSTTRLVNLDTSDEIRPRRMKKSVVFNSDSDFEEDNETAKNNTSPRLKVKNIAPASPAKGKKKINKQKQDEFSSNFEYDELDIFGDNVVSDPVLDNINALIADLDNDIDTLKSGSTENFENEISLENILGNITSMECGFKDITENLLNDSNKADSATLTIKSSEDNIESTEKDTPKISNPEPTKLAADNQIISKYESIEPNSKKTDIKIANKQEIMNEQVTSNENSHKMNNEDLVSTSENDIVSEKPKNDDQIDHKSNDGCSTPDSTIINDAALETPKEISDSTKEINNESNSDVTSTLDTVESSNKDVAEPISSQKYGTSLGSIGSLLSILKDKSKIKELLSMLGATDNDKMKKKLEKLSAIVSDDEDNDTVVDSNVQKEESNLQKEDISILKENSNLQKDDSSVQKEDCFLQKADSSLLIENTSVEYKNSNIQKEYISVQTVDGSVQKEDSGVQKENISVHKEYSSSIQNESSSEQKKDDSIKKGDSSVQKEDNSVEQKDNGVQRKDSSLQKGDSAQKEDKSFGEKLIEKAENTDGDVEEKSYKNSVETDFREKSANESSEFKETEVEVERKDSENESDSLEQNNDDIQQETRKKKMGPKKKPTVTKKPKGKFTKKIAPKRIGVAKSESEKPRRKRNELQKLQQDIQDMFISNDILKATGIRMCRLAKMVDKKDTDQKDGSCFQDPKPVVVLQKFSDSDKFDATPPVKVRKKPGPKPKFIPSLDEPKTYNKPTSDGKPTSIIQKPGPKSKTKVSHKEDPYVFETDVSEFTKDKESSSESDSESESCSLASSSKSCGSSEVLSDLKKKKRKRGSWQTGIIRPKYKKKKVEQKQVDVLDDGFLLPKRDAPIPDYNCFIDKMYCFQKNLETYSCRLCVYTGTDIINHYKQKHPHTEIPLSRLNPITAKEAIQQSDNINLQAFSKVPSTSYTCRFCYKVFFKSKSLLEKFFWHVVSMHTGEYRQACSECTDVSQCPFHLDIPPPPKYANGQLIGYICEKCNFTQISLENLKTHVIVRHNDEQTVVYTINLSAMSKKKLNSFMKKCSVPVSRPLRSTRSSLSMADTSDEHSDVAESESDTKLSPEKHVFTSPIKPKLSNSPVPVPQMQSKITFETEENTNNLNTAEKFPIKIEQDQLDNPDEISNSDDIGELDTSAEEPATEYTEVNLNESTSSDITAIAHFKVIFTETGAKEYVCCVNGNSHFRTTLLISLKMHVGRHSETWDGYCILCKVIVTPQGVHKFRDCLQHFTDVHMDEFPVMDTIQTPVPDTSMLQTPVEATSSPKPYINVRPLSDLLLKPVEDPLILPENVSSLPVMSPLPVIESVRSLTPTVEAPRPRPTYPTTTREKVPEKYMRYEEWQAEVMSKKHRVVLGTMMTKENLIKVFKCAGRFCSFTSDNAEEALLHASTHQRIGGEGTMNCAYCDFETSNNAIDLVMHVFKMHGRCQYACGLCFYRAAASQLVGAHIANAHPNFATEGNVLRTTSVTAAVAEDSNVLPREQAVRHYLCVQKLEDGRQGICGFRTYTPGKFCEHLLNKHEPPHSCAECNEPLSSAADLIVHMKIHGYMLYQCTWCVYGAEKEAELISHVASIHPDRQPQAYIRIITNKDGSSELRVLPLAYLNKAKVPTEDVTPSKSDDPVREADRSIELEKLIGHTTMLMDTSIEPTRESENDDTPILESSSLSECIEPTPAEQSTASFSVIPTEPIGVQSIASQNMFSIASLTPTVSLISTTAISTSASLTSTASLLPTASVVSMASLTTIQSSASPIQSTASVTSVQSTVSSTVQSLSVQSTASSSTDMSALSGPISKTPPHVPNLSLETTPVLKSEPVKSKVVVQDVVSLESDDDELRQDIIDLSDEEPAPQQNIQVKPNMLLKCPECITVCRTQGGLRNHYLVHMRSGEMKNMTCPHKPCTKEWITVDDLIQHYTSEHRPATIKTSAKFTKKHPTFKCSKCENPYINLQLTKKHMKDVHNIHNVCVTSTKEAGTYVVTESQKKRKPSTDAKKKTSKDPVKRNYGPEEINQLPINPILETLVHCSLCKFNTKVRLNMVRHLQLHLEQQPAPQTAPVNPVPHLESNEKHFDKMVNLASSSVVTRGPDKSTKPDNQPTVTSMIPPEAASKYPKYVPERQRLTCGAKGCSYISVDETMLKCHWETLHSGTNDYHCVHCPPYQYLDTSRPLTAARVITHLKMHDVNLYACASCPYYHYSRNILEKHLNDVHKGGQVMVVREETSPVVQHPVPAPTMDLKPWQCGLCKFKSMIRPEVSEHCYKVHQSKMQYKCGYCPFRTSAVENVSKHQANAHAGRVEDIFYYYYRENSIPDDADGTPRWARQRQKMNLDREVKTEVPDAPSTSSNGTTSLLSVLLQTAAATPTVSSKPTVDLNIVKKEVEERSVDETEEELCKRYGQFCEPNGLRYRCSLCKFLCFDTREAMQSHLYEELQYRKWGCGLCSYKAFHVDGFNEHMASEHRLKSQAAIQLPVDTSIENWTRAYLDHQSQAIKKKKDMLDGLKQAAKATTNTTPVQPEKSSQPDTPQYADAELEKNFGVFGAACEGKYCCPKCEFMTTELELIKSHLEDELGKIRWTCSHCSVNFQTYHQAQYHCRSVHANLICRPNPATRNFAMRNAWVNAVIDKQKRNMSIPNTPEKTTDMSDPSDNSLLVVRYEESVEEHEESTSRRKRAASDSDDEDKLVIDEPESKKRQRILSCQYCDFSSKHQISIQYHELRHYNLQPLMCNYCSFTGQKSPMLNHLRTHHPDFMPVGYRRTPLPDGPPTVPNLGSRRVPVDDTQLVCLHCGKTLDDTSNHSHADVKPEFARKGTVVVKCCICLTLRLDVKSLEEHHNATHPVIPMNYAYHKLHKYTRQLMQCGHCDRTFKFVKDYNSHHNAVHSSLTSKYTVKTFSSSRNDDIVEEDGSRPKRVARKSTTKLPLIEAVAKKSTTKLPYTVDIEEDEEYSYYGTKPSVGEYENVTTVMPFGNGNNLITVKELNKVINISPRIYVENFKKNF